MSTLYTARWVLPVAGPPVQDGAVAVGEDGRIVAVGPAAGVAAEGARRIDLGEAALMPGLVNVHAHPELSGFRGYLEDLPFHRWIPSLLRARREAGLADEDYAAAARWSCIEALRAGITTMAATEDSGAALDALVEAGMRGIVYREVFGPAPEQAADAVARLRQRLDSMRDRATELVTVGVSPHAPYTVSDDLYRDVARLALDEGLPLATHAAESPQETVFVKDGAGPFAEALAARGIATRVRATSTVALLDELGVMETRPLLIHAIQLDDEDMDRIRDRGATVAHCPIANARLGHGVAPVPELLERGVPIGLGTDSVASNNRLDLLEEARVAQLQQRSRLRDPTALPAERLLRMATLDGAAVLGLADRTGSLEPGKDADLCAVRLDMPHSAPVHDPVAAVVHAARGSDVVLTAVRGQALYSDGSIRTLDVGAARAAVTDIAVRIGRIEVEP